MSTVISVENVSKSYRLGQIGGGTLKEDVNRWWAKMRGKPDPSLKIGQEHHTRHMGEQFWALEDVSFAVKEGEVLGVIGRNGAGKSTLLKILSQVTCPTSGQIKIRGRIASLLEVGTGFNPELTGRENVFLNGAILGMTKTEIRSKFDEIVAFSEIEEFIDTPVKRYSSGMYVRLAFSVAAHLEPEILILDEVLAVGDAQFQQKCMAKMKEVSGKHGRTILFVSHNIAAIQNLCGTCVMLKNGKFFVSGATEYVLNTYLKEYAQNQRKSLEDFPNRSGSGAIKLTGFHIEDADGCRIDEVISGSDFDLVFDYKCAQSAGSRNVNIGISVHMPDGAIICVLYSSYTGKIFESVSATGELRCHVKRLPLKEGCYQLGARVEAEGEEADWPQGMIGTLDVIGGDFYGSGVKGFDGAAPLLLAATWSSR
jgi:lipopolysaccharide transport system ATP-binding protein